jgi:hypothetical protein
MVDLQLYIRERLLYILQDPAYAYATDRPAKITRVLRKERRDRVHVSTVEVPDETLNHSAVVLDRQALL